VPKLLRSGRQHTLGVQGSVDLLVQRAEIADWQCWIGVRKDRIESIERRLGAFPETLRIEFEPDSSVPMGSRLLHCFANITIADVFHDATTISLSGLASGAAPPLRRGPRGLRPPKYRLQRLR